MKGKQKILFIITKSNWGGAQRYVYDLATGIKSDYEVVVALGGAGKSGQPVGRLAEKLKSSGIRSILVTKFTRDISAFNDLAAFFEIFSIIKRERPDIVHLNSSKAAGIGSLAARLLGTKKIFFTVHGFAFEEKRSLIGKVLLVIASWITLLLSTDVIMISNNEYLSVKNWPFVKDKLKVIFNGIDAPTFLPRGDARRELSEILRLKHGYWDSAPFYAVTVAELTRNKGLLYAVKAVSEIPNCQYWIIGSGEEKTAIETEISTRGVNDRITMAGYIDGAARYLKAFDCYVLPSEKEGVPYVLLEAGFAGLPSIATEVGGISNLITKETGILLKPGKPEEISSALKYLIQHPTEAHELGSKLESLVRTNFNKSRMIDKVTAAYKDVSK